jgi:ABC-type nitrate/sulfonate/bicarbonate transport system substrate-binding protein
LDGEVDLAVGPSEHLFFYRKKSGNNPVAVASILQKDRSAFCVKAADGVAGPGDLANHTYIGYNTPLEEAILTAMMHNAGLDMDPAMRTPGRLEVWDEFLRDEKGIAWVFRHWEGALAESEGTELTCFTPADYGVPYGYSSVLMAREKPDADEALRLRKFLKVTERGYRDALAMSPDSLAVVLRKAVEHPNFEDVEFVTLAAKSIRDAFIGEGDVWGTMEKEQWRTYLNWIRAEVREEQTDSLFPADAYFTNRYLD